LHAPGISIKNATLTYHNQILFDQLNLEIPAGQWSTFLGPSGIGKSSLLRLIANLETGGTISVATRITSTNHLPLEKSIAYMSQHDSLMPWLSIIENVLLGYKLRGQSITKVKNKALQLLRQVELEQAVNKRPKSLSGGMRQRTALVRTLIEDKPIVLMDEPFSALDVITRLKLQTIAHELLKNKTVILVTHDPLEAIRLSDNIFIMQGCPATIVSVIKPTGPTPRNPTDVEVLTIQSQLLQILQQTHEVLS